MNEQRQQGLGDLGKFAAFGERDELHAPSCLLRKFGACGGIQQREPGNATRPPGA